MYQSLYRKYRPSTFADVVGQEVPVKILKNALVNNRIAHAYLFAGIRGTGKTSIAKIFAKSVNCANPKDGNPCNKCVSCTQINNVDIVEIDAASNNGVDEIRELRNKVTLVPSNSKYKVYIIDEVHMLSTNAFNALLKTLEEPPAHVIFILATTEAHKIPLTILSRCQRLNFKEIPIPKVVERLKYICEQESIKITETSLNEIARISNGGMRDAISLLEQSWAYSDNITEDDVYKMNGTIPENELLDLFDAIATSNIQKSFELTSNYESEGVNFSKLIDELLFQARTIMIDLVSETNNKKYTLQRIIEIIKKMTVASNEIKIVANKKIVFETMMIELVEKEKNVTKTVVVKEEEKPSKAVVNQEYVKEIIESFKTTEKKAEKPTITSSDFEQIKKIRIDNTLAEFDKRTLNALQKKLECIRDYAIDLEYGNIAKLLLDGTLKAASKEYMIYMYEEKNEANEFNSKICKIQEFLNVAINHEYKVIAINSNEWEIIKEEFNGKKKKYEKTEETEEMKEKILNLENGSKDFLDTNFFDIINYE